MLRTWIVLVALVLPRATFAFAGQESQAPKIDKQRFETYLRYAEAFAPNVKMSIDDPTPSAFKGYFRVLVHLSAGAQKLDRVYYVLPDGQQFISGNLWNLNQSPFLDALGRLPANGPSFGPANAKVTIVVFSDFECPYCRELAKTIRYNIPQKYLADVRVIFENFPIDSIHKWARAAGEAGHCIAEQNATVFWKFHDWIFEHQQEVNETNLREKVVAFAKQENLDGQRFSGCLDSRAAAEEVTRDEEAGAALQISRTPTLFINGRMIDGAVPWETLDNVIKIELNRPKEIPGASGEKCCEVSIPTATKK